MNDTARSAPQNALRAPLGGKHIVERRRAPGIRHRRWLDAVILIGLVLRAVLNASGAASAGSQDAVTRLAEEVRDRGWIVYGARSDQGDWDLFACRPDGSASHALTRTPEFNEFTPQVSRDGRQMLYRRLKCGEKFDNNRYGEQGELVVANRDGTNPQVLGNEGEFPWASWSPDGRQIASLSIKGMVIVDVATKQVVRRLERKGFFQQVTWSPDGLWLIGVANSFGTGWSIARMNVATGSADAVNRVDCCTPDWFPDSRSVIFSWRPQGQKTNHGNGWTQLWMADAEGKSRQLVYGEDGRHVYGGNVSPDGKYVLFTGNVQEDGDPGNAGAPMGLMRLSDSPIIGGESADLRALHPEAKNGPVVTLPVGWEPCWTLSDIPETPASLSANTDSARPVGKVSELSRSASEVAKLAAELRPNGWLVFSSKTERGDWDLFRMRPDGTDRRKFIDMPGFNEGGARFSPDGKRMLFYRLPVSDELQNNEYGTGRYNCTSDWVADSRRVVYARGIVGGKPGRAELWVGTLDGHEPQPLYAEEGHHIYGACASPDMKYLLFTRSLADLTKVDHQDTTMAIIRWADTPMRGDEGESLRQRFPEARTGPRLDLGAGWEPFWTLVDLNLPQPSTQP